MIKLKTNNIDISIPLKLSKTQEITINSLKTDKAKIEYAMSFLGIKTRNIRPSKKIDYSTDHLASKSKNHVLHLLRSLSDASSQKHPMTKSFHFGIELEFLINKDDFDIDYNEGRYCPDCEGSGTLTYRHRDTGHETESDCQTCDGSGTINCDSDDVNAEEQVADQLASRIKSNGIRYCQVKTDGSLSDDDDDYIGIEIAVLTTDFKNLKKLLEFLHSNYDIKINETCGLHIHLDARSYSLNNLSESTDMSHLGHHNLLASMPWLFEILPHNRRSSTYCKLGKDYDNRYRAVNLTAFNKFKTIEVRSHSGTVNYDKIVNWCNILKTIFTSEPKREPQSFQDLLDLYDFSSELKEYIIMRRNKFTPEE